MVSVQHVGSPVVKLAIHSLSNRDSHRPSSLGLQEEDDANLYMSIQRLRDRTSELSNKVSLLERLGSGDLTYQQSLEELRAAQDQLSELVEARNHR